MLIGALALGVLLTSIFYNNKNQTIIFEPNIIVKDSTQVNDLNKLIESDSKYFISNSLESIVSKEFEKTTSYLNYTTVLFGIFLTIVLVVFGFFTVNRMKEINDAPELFMKRYQENELKEYLPKLYSKNNSIKSDAISRLSLNTELNYKNHFKIFSELFMNEFETENGYSYSNILILFDILRKLDYSKSIKMGYKAFLNYPSSRNGTMKYIIPILIDAKDKKSKRYFKKSLLKSNFFQEIAELDHHYDIYDLSILKHVAKNGKNNLAIRIFSEVISHRKGEFDLIKLLDCFNELFYYCNKFFKNLLQFFEKNNQLTTDNMKLITKKFFTHNDKNLHNTQQFLFLIHKYLDEKKLEKIVLLLKEELIDKEIFEGLKRTNFERFQTLGKIIEDLK